MSSWTAAEAYAQSLGGHLASIRSTAEQAWIQTSFLSGVAATTTYWIGLHRTVAHGPFSWADGSPVTYVNWRAPSEPNDDNGCMTAGEAVVAIYWHSNQGYSSSFGQWNDTHDAGVQYPFPNGPRVCEYPLRGIVEIPAPLLVTLQPIPVATCSSGSAGFSVSAAGTGPFTFQWQSEDANAPGGWVDLTDGPFPGVGTVAGASTSDISMVEVLPAVALAGGLSFHCIVTSACGSVTSNPAQLFVDPSDMGQQGGLPGRDGLHDNNDFIVFIDLFFNQQPAADLGSTGGVFGPDGQFDNNDFVVFIDQFFAGCP